MGKPAGPFAAAISRPDNFGAAGSLRFGRGARRSSLAWLVPVAGVGLAAGLIGAGSLAGALGGRGWSWPPAGDLLAAALGPLSHPGAPAAGWPRSSPVRLVGAGCYWAVFAVLVTVGVGLGLTAGAGTVRAGTVRPGTVRAGTSWAGTSRRRRSSPARRRRRRRRGRLPGLERREWSQLGFASPLGRTAGPLPDRRDRSGFAARAELRREASVAAARRRAPQTRPSLWRAVQGSSRALAPREVGYPLGRARPGGVALWPSWEASLRLVAPPGEGKTFRALVPILRQHPGPAVATSTKADLYELTAVARRRRGPVVAFDPDGLVPGAPPARWSPVTGCQRSEVAERRATALVAATAEDADSQNGAFFRDSARDLLKAYLHAAALEDLDMRVVLEWSRRPEDPTPADLLASSPWAAPGWGDLITLHTTGAAETTSGVMRYVARALACFSHEAVVAACCPPPGEELDIGGLIRDNGTLYLMGKASRLGAVAPLLTALADEVFDCAERMAVSMPTRRLDPPLLGLLDEAPSIAPLPSLPDLLADGRGRGIVVVYAMQSFSQAVTRWGAHKAETMGNSTTITAVLGGLTSPSDLADLERLCGQRRVRRQSDHRGTRGQGGAERSRTISWDNEPVLRADQIRTLPSGTALVLWSKLPPVLAHLSLLSEMPDWPQIRKEEEIARRANDEARARAWG